MKGCLLSCNRNRHLVSQGLLEKFAFRLFKSTVKISQSHFFCTSRPSVRSLIGIHLLHFFSLAFSFRALLFFLHVFHSVFSAIVPYKIQLLLKLFFIITLKITHYIICYLRRLIVFSRCFQMLDFAIVSGQHLFFAILDVFRCPLANALCF